MEILGYLILFVYFYAIYLFSKEYLSYINTFSSKSKLLFIISLFLPGVLILYAMSDEKYIYFFDYSNYWIKAINYNKIIDKEGLNTFQLVYQSINNDLYNDLIVIPITLVCKTLGFEFRYFTFSIYLVYAIPVSLIYSNLIFIVNKKNIKELLFLPFSLLLLIPLILPIRFGFVDIAGLVVLGMIFNLYFKSSKTQKIEIKRYILIGILLLLFLFTRRYFTFVFIAFFLVGFSINVAIAIKNKNFKEFLYGSSNLAIAGFTTFILMVIFFYPFLEITFLTNYRDIYSGYRKLTWLGHYNNYIYRFGYISFVLMGLGIWGFVKNKKFKTLSFLLISLFLIYFTFVKFNDLGPQHYYVIMPFIILLLGGIFLFEIKTRYNFLLLSILFLFGISFYYNVLTNEKPPLGKFFVTSEMNKLERADYMELQKMASDIKNKYSDGHYTYCISNSPVLNYSILNNFDLPKQIKITPGFFASQDVDKRDNFPNELFLADYVIVTNPSQIHLKPESQQIIVYFNENIRDGKFKDHYIVEKQYSLINDTKVFLLKKIKGFTEEEIIEIKSHFQKLYPDYPNMYDVKEHYLKLKTIRNGDNFGNIKFENNNNISIHPGVDRNSEFEFDLDSLKTYKINFKATFRDKENITKNCNPESDGEVFLYLYKNDNLLSKSYITHKKDTIINMEITNAKSFKIMVDKGMNQDWCDWFYLENFQLN